MDGLRAMCEQAFDLVMMDIQMPGMDGVEALGWFRQWNRDERFDLRTPATTPVVAVTANALEGDRSASSAWASMITFPNRFARANCLPCCHSTWVKHFSSRPRPPTIRP